MNEIFFVNDKREIFMPESKISDVLFPIGAVQKKIETIPSVEIIVRSSDGVYETDRSDDDHNKSECDGGHYYDNGNSRCGKKKQEVKVKFWQKEKFGYYSSAVLYALWFSFHIYHFHDNANVHNKYDLTMATARMFIGTKNPASDVPLYFEKASLVIDYIKALAHKFDPENHE